jgi:hypothetical protein
VYVVVVGDPVVTSLARRPWLSNVKVVSEFLVPGPVPVATAFNALKSGGTTRTSSINAPTDAYVATTVVVGALDAPRLE